MTENRNIRDQLRAADYVADDALSTALQLAINLKRPLLLEGEAGVGKTEVAKALASIMQTNLIRLQCYEGLDAAAAIYEWNYQKQLLYIKASEREDKTASQVEQHIFTEDFLLERPLLQAIGQEISPVLLIDEIDRADEEFEAYLLEILSDFQITVPELGTITATSVPHVILTSNGTRELSDALRRRCLYSYVDFPSQARELEIILSRVPDIEAGLADQISRFVLNLRKEELEKNPGVAETLDWAAALVGLKISSLDGDLETIQSTLICLLKTETDLKSITKEVASRLLGKAA
ncbi:MoxR family ATPase [Sneathiella marina]|uniref:MoxR family ATPase n=1 Tax=Sneathiella marina TaxID=2950108 RepID=A0ABY4WC56_9PROT|nr:MoxR family ATPase [Sneathiella marina]USG62824.1 MoxR family ATPase [Sneathiella marina]